MRWASAGNFNAGETGKAAGAATLMALIKPVTAPNSAAVANGLPSWICSALSLMPDSTPTPKGPVAMASGTIVAKPLTTCAATPWVRGSSRKALRWLIAGSTTAPIHKS